MSGMHREPHAIPGHAAAAAPRNTNSSSGRIYFWPGASLWIGEGQGRTLWHEHHAHQLTLALEGDFRFRTQADGRWEVFAAAIVPGHCAHQFDLDSGRLAHVFIEPESKAGRALTQRFGSADVSALPADDAAAAAALLRSALDARRDAGGMIATANEALAVLSGAGSEPAAELDARLARSLEYIKAHIRRPISLSQAAAAATLSESRFRHLFVAETGCSFRAYVLWLRINVAIEAVMAGATWTEAAHEAGFADSAHLTRTHKRMFGIEPSSLRPQ